LIRKFLLVVILLCLAGSALAAPVPVDTAHSRLTVRVFKTGLFSGFAHDHEISAPLSSGTIDAAALSVDVRFEARKMTVLDPDASASDRAKVQETMLSEKVLDAAKFPGIVFVSKNVKATGNNVYSVEGDLTLHGVTHAVTVPVSFANGHYTGSAKLKQTDFGIQPIKIAGGSVKVKDEIDISFDIVVQPN
jgi:polyisoprenoid-binding protein YceI